MKHLIKGTNSLEVIQMPEKLLRKAVLNQIAWWKAVCATHDITTACMDNVWIADQYVPSYYPEMITETREATVEKIPDRVSTIMDSYATLQIPGFTKLFKAQWMTSSSVVPYCSEWKWVRNEEAFQNWLVAANLEGMLQPSIIDNPHVLVFHKEGYGGFSAYQSHGIIGIFNVFGVDHVFQDIPAVLANFFPKQPIVGYEADERLAAAMRGGWSAIGPLTIWTREVAVL